MRLWIYDALRITHARKGQRSPVRIACCYTNSLRIGQKPRFEHPNRDHRQDDWQRPQPLLGDAHCSFDLGQSRCTAGVVSVAMNEEQMRLSSLGTFHDSLGQSSTCCVPPCIRPRSQDLDASKMLPKNPTNDEEQCAIRGALTDEGESKLSHPGLAAA